jgi:cyclic pyranopterin phosphate synthase
MELTHINDQGRGKMVDVSEKPDTKRYAMAQGEIRMGQRTLELIMNHGIKKGDVLSVAQVGGIMGAKRTADMIPMCHNIPISGVDITFDTDVGGAKISITAHAHTVGKTGIEMEALCAVSTAALTIYDMCKAVDKDMVITNIRLMRKSGGRSGEYSRE